MVLTGIIDISLTFGLYVPLQGYSEPTVVKQELVSFLNDNDVYLFDCGDEYVYKIISNKDRKNGEVYETKKVQACNSIKHESENCKEPVLIISEKKPVRGIWTFALCCDSEKEYIFVLPKNTVKIL